MTVKHATAPRGSFAGEGNALLEELIMACQVKPVASGVHADADARAKTLVPYFEESSSPVQRSPSPNAPAKKRHGHTGKRAQPRRSSETNPAANTVNKRIATPVSFPKLGAIERCAGPGFFAPPSPEQLPLPKLLMVGAHSRG